MFKVKGTVRMTPEMLKALESASNRNGTGDMQVNISVSADPAEMSMSTKSVNISVSAEPVKNMFTKPVNISVSSESAPNRVPITTLMKLHKVLQEDGARLKKDKQVLKKDENFFRRAKIQIRKDEHQIQIDKKKSEISKDLIIQKVVSLLRTRPGFRSAPVNMTVPSEG